MDSAAITISDLAFRYLWRAEWALNGITLEVMDSEFLGITGPSGAGKSTFCLSLNGLVPHVIEGTMRGTVSVRGFDTRKSEVSQLSSFVGIVFQDPRSQLTGSAMTVEEEVAFGLQNLGVPREAMRDRITEALDAVGLSGFETRAPFELSGGEQQRLSLATAIAMRPQIMILDEPTELLDPEGAVSVMKAVHSVHERYHMTTILVSNQPETLAQYAERICILNDGRIVAVDSPQEFSRKVRFAEKLGIRHTQVAQVAAMLDDKGLWRGDYPLDEYQAAKMIERQFFGE
jgi:energy-coupling factor transporter ATP-binding protein EcfA2